MDQLTLLFLLMFGTVLVVPLAGRLRLPFPVLLTLYGVLLGWLPFVPTLRFDPELLLPLLLPPLLYAAAQRSSWREFAANARPIMLLAVALVLVTTVVVAAVANAMIPGLPLAGAVALGALVAPPDPVAATAVAGSLRLPRRLVSILEGEGLFNDVTSLVLYQVAVAAVVSGTFSPARAVGVFALSAVVGVGIGFAVGFAGRLLLARLGEPNLQTLLTLLVPFMAYVVADQLHGSGVLAVLTTAFYLGSVAEDADNVVGRLTGRSFWEVVDLVVTGVAFGVIGLEMWEIFHGIHGDRGRLLWQAGAVVLVLIVVRGLWLFPVAALARRLHNKLPTSGETQTPDPRETVVVWWAGMRGVVTIALALALPLTTDAGDPFPERQRLLAIAFCVIVVTLLLQGVTLPWLVRRLDVREADDVDSLEERLIAATATKAALHRLRELDEERDLPDEMVQRLRARQKALLAELTPDGAVEELADAVIARSKRIKLLHEIEGEMNAAARREVIAARSRRGVDPAAADRVLRRLDLRSMR
ncbi:Na+/H+ antiporter [Streptomyces sp. SID3343]|uniref:Na+/H+ antiporter n=1 Tax=Streptomyces sp. SID3343 TaxID=2690260 RepID=UPI00136ADA13|nr:Na+/H+ antiporter [Streptomyces sp. SID3343]